jgi:ABC-2 type transport system ATP-binding protein
MDPEGIIWMRGFLRSLAAQDRAVLVSSHLMGELQDLAGHVVVAGRGRVIADTSVAELLASVSGGRITVRASAPEAATVLAEAGASVTATGDGGLSVTGLPAETIAAVLQRRGVAFSELSAHRATLEDAYLALTGDAVEYRGTAPEQVR